VDDGEDGSGMGALYQKGEDTSPQENLTPALSFRKEREPESEKRSQYDFDTFWAKMKELSPF